MQVSINVLELNDQECNTVGDKTVCPPPPYLEEHGDVTLTEKIMGELIIGIQLAIIPPETPGIK